ncbi:MAG: Nif3-like dinuclear metal center hexameric protein, partial [Treponemataceae bacterium]|nr:Nif3-like dinuclear metal center hexameric protein [Treponemataceae bacterium]
MTLHELDAYFNAFLKKELFAADPSRNGIQIANSAPDHKPITKVAFAVDACESSAQRAAQAGANIRFVQGSAEDVLTAHPLDFAVAANDVFNYVPKLNKAFAR